MKVLLCLLTHNRPGEITFPSIDLIAEETDLRKDHVYIALQELERDGWLGPGDPKRTGWNKRILDPNRVKARPKSGLSKTQIGSNLDPNRVRAIRKGKEQEENNGKDQGKSDEPTKRKDELHPAHALGTPDEPGEFMKIGPVRRDKSGQEQEEAPRELKAREAWMRVQNLAQHLAMHTRKDYRNYVGAGQNAVWARLLELHTYEGVKNIIDDAMSPTNRGKLKEPINAFGIEFFLKVLPKDKKTRVSDEERAKAMEMLKDL